LRYTPSTAAASVKKGLASGIAFGPPKTERSRKSAAEGASTAAARQVWLLPGNNAGQTATNTATNAASNTATNAGASGTPVAVAVVPGISDGHMTEIVGGDLKAGMQVITAQKTSASK
jgi:HlyD family secretion protein